MQWRLLQMSNERDQLLQHSNKQRARPRQLEDALKESRKSTPAAQAATNLQNPSTEGHGQHAGELLSVGNPPSKSQLTVDDVTARLQSKLAAVEQLQYELTSRQLGLQQVALRRTEAQREQSSKADADSANVQLTQTASRAFQGSSPQRHVTSSSHATHPPDMTSGRDLSPTYPQSLSPDFRAESFSTSSMQDVWHLLKHAPSTSGSVSSQKSTRMPEKDARKFHHQHLISQPAGQSEKFSNSTLSTQDSRKHKHGTEAGAGEGGGLHVVGKRTGRRKH